MAAFNPEHSKSRTHPFCGTRGKADSLQICERKNILSRWHKSSEEPHMDETEVSARIRAASGKGFKKLWTLDWDSCNIGT